MPAATMHVRPFAYAGTFYPADASALRHEIASLLRDCEGVGPIPKGLIVPHAGYRFSGPVAASGYALLKPIHSEVDRVVLLGPSHRASFYGLAASGAEAFATPLGTIALDSKAIDVALKLPQVHLLEEVHGPEHSLEVQLPFLQMILGEFSLAPFVVGRATADEIAEVLEHLWAPREYPDETLIIASSDLSHCHDYWTARAVDSETCHLIERRQWEQLTGERACGYRAVRGLLKVTKARGLRVKTVDLRNSGDTAGIKEQVVGYGSFVVYR